MHRIIEIVGIEKHDKFSRTHAILDDGSETIGYGVNFKVGDEVESFWDERWSVYKMRQKPIDNNDVDVVDLGSKEI